jgi:hypothetical protein
MCIQWCYVATVFETIKKFIIFSTVSIYRLECLVVSVENEEKGMFWIDWILVVCGTVATLKATSLEIMLLTSSGSSSKRIMLFYFQNLVTSASFIKALNVF